MTIIHEITRQKTETGEKVGVYADSSMSRMTHIPKLPGWTGGVFS